MGKLLCWGWLFCIALATSAEGAGPILPKELNEPLAKAVAEREPGWRLAKVVVYPEKTSGLFQRWTPRDGVKIWSEREKALRHPSPDVTVQVYSYESAEKASESLHFGIKHTQVSPSGVIRDFGDEAYGWSGYGPHGQSAVRIRKGRVLVSVNGPTLDITMRFAKLLLEETEKELQKAGQVP